MKHMKWTNSPLFAIFKDESGNIKAVSANGDEIEKRRWSTVDGGVPYVTRFEEKCAELRIPAEQVLKALANLNYSHG